MTEVLPILFQNTLLLVRVFPLWVKIWMQMNKILFERVYKITKSLYPVLLRL